VISKIFSDSANDLYCLQELLSDKKKLKNCESNISREENQEKSCRMDAWTRVWRREGEMAPTSPSEAVAQPMTTGWDSK